jgi:acyl transferase domain-containing protein
MEPIAVIGFSLKFPQDAESPVSFWKMLEEKRCALTEWPKDRINLDGYFSRDGEGASKTFIPGAHFVKEDLGVFDAPFFGISATEATAMDPQHRILLETAYRALESGSLLHILIFGSSEILI